MSNSVNLFQLIEVTIIS